MEVLDFLKPAVVRLTIFHPFWVELFYSMTLKEALSEDGVETAATDGRTLWANRAFFSKLPLDQQVGVLVHELGHKMFLHPSRMGHRHPEVWNIAADYATNGLLKLNNIQLPADVLINPKYENWTAEAIYTDLMNNAKQAGGQGQGLPQLPGKWRDLMAPSGSPEDITKHEDEVKALVDRAIATAKAMGNLPAGIEAATVQAFKAAEEPWYNHLHRFMQSLAISEYNWARLNRRALQSHGVFAPLHYAEALGEIVIFVDTSGSCYDRAQQVCFAEHINAILAEAKPRKIHVVYFDTRVYPGEVVEAGEFDIHLSPKGGGGTSFVPLFQYPDDEGIEPDVAIVLTDMMGTFPAQAPSFPVIWADVYGQCDAPFGEVLRVAAV